MHQRSRANPHLPSGPRTSKGRGTGIGHALTLRTIVLVLIALVAIGLAPSTFGQTDPADVPNLEPGTRIYDETGTSLTPEETADLERQLGDLDAVGANVIVMVRELNASPEETLEQVEALQQAWVAETGADQDTAVALLINRNPNDPNDARAGIYVGSTYDDGNVPRDEQEAIVSEALIPPLREGDVYGSFSAALDRLERSIVEGPPQTAFERWSSSAADSWLPVAGLALALAGLAAALAVFRTRQRINTPGLPPTTTRPGTLPPAMAGALATSGPQASAVPAIILDLATRDALAIEPEDEGGLMSKPTIQVRIVDSAPVQDEAEAALWTEMEKRADNGVVSSKNLAKVAHNSKPVREAIERQMHAEGWLDPDAPGRRAVLMVISMVAGLLAIFSTIVAGTAGDWMPVIAIVPLAALSITAIVFFGLYPKLTPHGQEAALPWKAYRKGLKDAAKDKSVDLDLNEVLVDSIAMNLGSEMNDRLKAANEAGEALRAFTSPQGTSYTMAFPYWVAFSGSVSTSSGSSSSGVTSGGGAGGGGGAAGST